MAKKKVKRRQRNPYVQAMILRRAKAGPHVNRALERRKGSRKVKHKKKEEE